MPDTRFKCPHCGGSSFGSTLHGMADGPMHRYCHGNDAGDSIVGCTFNWPDKDDWRYFLVDGKKVSAEEWAAVEAKIRGISVEGRPYPDHEKPQR